MKKLLTATTALALVCGAAAAEVTVGGDARFGLSYDSEADNQVSVHQRFRAKFSASGTTDGGLAFSGEANINSESGAAADGVVSVSGAFGKLAFGALDAADTLAGGIADVGIKGIGVDDVAEGGLRNYTDSGNLILYTQSFGSLNFGVSASPGVTPEDGADPSVSDDDTFAVGMNFTASGMKIGLGFDSEETVSLGASYTTGQITASAYFAERDGDDGAGVDVSYSMGATTVTLVAATNSADVNGFGMGVSHDLGGGASLVAGFAQVPGAVAGEDKNGAEVGLTFAF
ncbi:MAG: porin [Rhodobacteraceae bacterium]|nr:porin [Paracoccaceae bacterium]